MRAPAKVNLYLGVGGLRPDGYHEVTTVLQELGLADEVDFAPAEGLSFTCEPDLDLPAEENLAWKAAAALSRAAGRPLDVSIAVRKRIPAGAGLGGGSSNAAAVLKALCRMWGISPVAADVLEVARSIGADVPFFLRGGAGLMSGRGDELVRELEAPVMQVVVVWPRAVVGTPEAYAAFDALPPASAPGPDALVEALESGEHRTVAARLHNDMTEASTGLVGAIADALALVRGSDGVLGAEMCGSGSAVFGICETQGAARAAARAAQGRGWWAEATLTTGGSATVAAGARDGWAKEEGEVETEE